MQEVHQERSAALRAPTAGLLFGGGYVLVGWALAGSGPLRPFAPEVAGAD